MNPTQGGWLILLSVIVALLAAIVHLPESWPQWLGWLRPAWVVLVVFCWVMELPHRIGLISAWFIGLSLDVLAADPLGLNGAILAGITYVTWRFYERLRMYAVLQQSVLLFILVALAEWLRALMLHWSFDLPVSWGFLLPALVSAVAWPFVYLVLQRLRIQFRVA